MKASELRIGNLVKLEGISRPIKVSIIDTTETSTNTKYKPIPLTEEWLLRLPEDLVSEDIPSWIESIHELQNWYYIENKCKKELSFE